MRSRLHCSVVGRTRGAIAIIAGAGLIGFNPNRWDSVLLTLPGSRAVDVTDVLGLALILVGIATFWHAPSRPRLAGVIVILVGTTVIDSGHWPHDGHMPHDIFLTLPRGHGIHVTDALGMLIIVLGIAVLWRATARQGRPLRLWRRGSATPVPDVVVSKPSEPKPEPPQMIMPPGVEPPDSNA